MFRIGLSSSALLLSPPSEVVSLAKAAGFDGIEWAGDPHLPVGDDAAAREVMMATLRAGLTTAAYAPLHRVLAGGGGGIGFSSILATAVSINAPIIRVYAGRAPLPVGTARASLLDELRRLGDEAGSRGVAIALSPGPRTCMATSAEALALVDEISHPFVRLAWEPLAEGRAGGGVEALVDRPAAFILVRARRLSPEGVALPLDDGTDRWSRLLGAFAAMPGPTDIGRFALLGGAASAGKEGMEALAADLAFARASLARARSASEPGSAPAAPRR